MSKTVIEVENLSKLYRLGAIGATTFKESFQHFWYRLRKREDLYYKISKKHLMISPDDPQAGPEPNTIWALKDVSFSVNEGEIVGIIGNNGAGKSTLLKILSRITAPTKGKAIIRGRVGSLLEVGTGFHQELTGRENIYLNGTILGMRKKEIDKIFDEIVSFAEIDKFIDTPVKHYSSGMYVRLAFSVAAHLRTEILLVDEVLAVGDAAFQKKCLGKMGEVAKEGRTVLFVSHNMGAIQQLTHKSILLSSGQVFFFGGSSEAVAKYFDTVMSEANEVYYAKNSRRIFPGGRRDVEFVSVKLMDYKNKIVPADADIRVKVVLRGNETCTAFRISLTIFKIDGTPVGSTFSAEDLSILKGEEAMFELRLSNLKLAEGQYYMGMAVGKGNERTGHIDFDIILDVLYFEVMSHKGDSGTRAYWAPNWGAIRFPEPFVKKLH